MNIRLIRCRRLLKLMIHLTTKEALPFGTIIMEYLNLIKKSSEQKNRWARQKKKFFEL